MKFPVYLDYSATTPIDPRVVEAMLPYLTEKFGNPASRSHQYGWDAEAAVENARAEVAALVHADPKEIVWTKLKPVATFPPGTVQPTFFGSEVEFMFPALSPTMKRLLANQMAVGALRKTLYLFQVVPPSVEIPTLNTFPPEAITTNSP